MLSGMPSRHAPPLLVLVAIACLAGLAAPANPASAASPATAASPASRLTTLCQQRAYTAVTSARGGHYVIKNDNYGGRPECIRNSARRPNFTVTRSRANSFGPEVMAYPFVLYGCSWGLCTHGSRLPARVRRVRHATASWATAVHARGRWNAAFDIWFGRHRSARNGQAQGAELMVWLNARDYPATPGKVIRVDHRRWSVAHWVTSHDGKHWTYIQVRALHPARRVHRLALLAVIARMERMGLVRRRWWLLNVEAGFEIWHGGRGLRTKWFSAHVSLK